MHRSASGPPRGVGAANPTGPSAQFRRGSRSARPRSRCLSVPGPIRPGRLREVARIIRGKHKPMFTPHMDTGDGVIVINASKVRVTGRKAEQKEYFRHTGYMGHERFTPFASMLAKHPERIIEKAVYGMLPKTALGRQKLRGKLRVFAGDKHTHAAQQPKVLDLNKKSEK